MWLPDLATVAKTRSSHRINHRMFGVGRDLCGSSGPRPLLKQGHPEQAAQNAFLYTAAMG